MKTDQIIDAIGGIDEELVLSALKTRRVVEELQPDDPASSTVQENSNRTRRRGFAIPAALLAVFAAFLIIMPKGMGRTTNPKYAVLINDTQLYYTCKESFFRASALCIYDTETQKSKRLLLNTIALRSPSGIIGFCPANGSVYKLSGENTEKIGEVKASHTTMRAEYYAALDNELFYIKDGKAIIKENWETGQITELLRREEKFDFIHDLGFCGTKMFYTDSVRRSGVTILNVYTADSTGQEIKVCEIQADDGSDFTGAYHVTYFDDFLAVSFTDGIFIIDAEDHSCRKISDTNTYSISLHDGKLYFISYEAIPSGEYFDYEYYISCIDLDSGEETRAPFDDNGNIKWQFIVTDKGVFYVDIASGLYYLESGNDKPVHIDK